MEFSGGEKPFLHSKWKFVNLCVFYDRSRFVGVHMIWILLHIWFLGGIRRRNKCERSDWQFQWFETVGWEWNEMDWWRRTESSGRNRVDNSFNVSADFRATGNRWAISTLQRNRWLTERKRNPSKWYFILLFFIICLVLLFCGGRAFICGTH